MRHGKGHASAKTVAPYLALILAGIILLAGAAAGAENKPSAPSEDGGIPDVVVRATALIGREVENNKEEVLAEIEDVLINEKGCISKVVLAIGTLFGIPDKRVAVSFDDVTLEKEWKYRIRYRDDGTKERVPWRLIWTVVYPGDIADLRNLPAYHYETDYPRGTVRGWGIYSREQ